MSTMDQPVRWEELDWRRIAALRSRGIDMVILPVGATEQHGAHLPTGVDTMIATAVAEGVSARTGIPMLPPLAYGVSLGHSMRWPGTLSLRPETLGAVIRDMAGWIEGAGFRRLLLLNGHVSNWAPLRCALENIRHDHPSMHLALRSVWEINPDVNHDYTRDVGGNFHANEAETSLMLHIAPWLVQMERAVDEPDRSAGCFFSWRVDQESETGVTGNPTEATAERGRELLERYIAAFSTQCLAALEERAPLDRNE